MHRRVRWFVVFATAFILGSAVIALLAGAVLSLQLVAIWAAVVAVFLLVADLVNRS